MHRFFIFAFLLLVAFIGGLYYIFHHVPQSEWVDLVKEHGMIEFGTVILFAVAAFFGLVQYIKNATKMNFIFMVLMAMAGAREMDWHKEWTTDSILKSRFYLDESTPALEKVIGAIVILFLIYAAWQLLKRVPQFIAGVWHFSETAWALGLGLGFLVIAKTIDSMARILPFMAEFQAENGAFLGVIEETMELTAALFFVALAFMRTRRV